MEVWSFNVSSIFKKFALVTILILASSTIHAQVFRHEMGQVDLKSTPIKVVSLDWVLTEHLLALGVTPYGIADVKGYQSWVVKPILPESVISIGSRREPNLELIAQIKPDLILMSDVMSPAFERLNAIAPTMVLSVYTAKHAPLEAAKQQLLTLGKVLNRYEQAQQVILPILNRPFNLISRRLKWRIQAYQMYYFCGLLGINTYEFIVKTR